MHIRPPSRKHIFEQRLFAAAITQLDANPVRFLNSEHPGSPLQDLLQQPFMRDIMKDDSFKQHLVDWFKQKFGNQLSTFVKNEVPPIVESKPAITTSLTGTS
jgi:hypothetical protein